jgi:hypothetical protein
MPARRWTLHVEPGAPSKPAVGAPCNGCGVCCLAVPCPLGMLLSRRRRGPCQALQWTPAQAVYRCGAMAGSLDVAQRCLPACLQRMAPWLAGLLRRIAPRWIAAGAGCDSNLEVETSTMASARGLNRKP